ncbi:MAG: alpha/beta hydrolase [Actinomycetia bacterium]|nr:alpha/beta hydrolase [Actinomycetes bacterium]
MSNELHHRSKGDGAPTLVLLHAGVADARMWGPLVENLASDHTVIWCDMRGFGRTPSTPEPFEHGEDVTAVVRSHTDGSVWLVGASLGSRVAVDLALGGDLDVAGLVLVPPTISGMAFDDDVSSSWDLVDERLEAGDVDGAVAEEVRVWVVGEDRTEAEVEPEVLALAREMIRTNSGHVDHDSEERRARKAYGALEEVDVPVLVMVGRHDRHEVRALAAEVAERCPDAALHVFDDAAHLVALERPDVVGDLVRRHVTPTG